MLLRPCTRSVPTRALRKSGANGASAPSCTRAPGGLSSSAKPPPPRTTSAPEVWKAGPSTWARQEASSGSRDYGLRRGHTARGVEAERVARRLHDGLPPGTATEVGAQARLDVAAGLGPLRGRRLERRQAHDDARRAEATLTGAARHEGVGPTSAIGRGETLEGGDVAAGDAPHRRHAGDPRGAIDPHGAAAALPLRATPVFHRTTAELLAQCVEEGDPLGDGDRDAVEGEGDRVRGGGATGAAQGADWPGRARLS